MIPLKIKQDVLRYYEANEHFNSMSGQDEELLYIFIGLNHIDNNHNGFDFILDSDFETRSSINVLEEFIHHYSEVFIASTFSCTKGFLSFLIKDTNTGEIERFKVRI